MFVFATPTTVRVSFFIARPHAKVHPTRGSGAALLAQLQSRPEKDGLGWRHPIARLEARG